MNESHDTAAEGWRSQKWTPSDDGLGPGRLENAPELRLTVVETEGRSARGTIHPPDLTGLERMETWLSADASAFVELSAWR